MKILHTSDWHLGRVYHGISLLEDQVYVLDQLIALVHDQKPDVVLIAGDVYDRAVPPADAVRLLDETLTRIVIGEGVPVILIAGNHDSPDRLGFGSRLLAEAGLTVRGMASRNHDPVILTDSHGSVAFYPLPYAEPAQVRSLEEDDSIADHHAGLLAQLDRIRGAHDSKNRSVVIAHAFVLGGTVSESERPLAVGGTGAVGAEVFSGFDFVALGHLHRPQAIGEERIHYSGSLLKYSFAEADYAKTVSLINIAADGCIQIERVPLKPRRDLRIVEGQLDEIVAAGLIDPGRDDYVLARLTDTGALLDAMTKLRTAYPNALSIERLQFSGRGQGLESGRDHRKIGIGELFQGFYKEMTGLDLGEAEPLLHAEIAALNRDDREVSA